MVIGMVSLRGKKREERGGGIEYAMYFIAIIIVCVIFVFLKFHADLYVVEEHLENGLHVAEMSIITTNQDELDANGKRKADIEREINRKNIVTKYDLTQPGSVTSAESKQLEYIGKRFQKALESQLNLHGSDINGEFLLRMCGPGSKIKIKPGSVKIYEPVYSRTVSSMETGEKSDHGFDILKFRTRYGIDKWIEYTLNFNENNEYTSSTKRVFDEAPKLSRGDTAEGATIEATLLVEFSGVREIFNMSEGGPFFANGGATHYNAEVTQAVDIVIAEDDSRRQN